MLALPNGLFVFYAVISSHIDWILEEQYLIQAGAELCQAQTSLS